MQKFTIILAALLVSACVTSSAASGTSEAVSEASLTASDWQFIAIDGAPPADPAKARMSFHEGRASANVGCNGMGGDWRIDGGRLITGPWMSTRMYCGGAIGQQENAVSALIGGNPRVSIEGDVLKLNADGHSATLRRVAAQD